MDEIRLFARMVRQVSYRSFTDGGMDHFKRSNDTWIAPVAQIAAYVSEYCLYFRQYFTNKGASQARADAVDPSA